MAVKLSLHSFSVDPNTKQVIIDPMIQGFLKLFYQGGISSNHIWWEAYAPNDVLDSGGPVKVIGLVYQLTEPAKNVYSTLTGFSLYGYIKGDVYDVTINPGNRPMKAVFHSMAISLRSVAQSGNKNSRGLKGILVQV